MLYVEDDSAAALLFKVILRSRHPSTTLRVIQNPDSVLAYLLGESPFEDATTPDLIVLDIHMPRMDGLSLLKQIRADARLVHLPAVFFSSSQSTSDHEQAAALGALAFIHKPHDLPSFEQALRRIHALAGQ